MSTILLIDDNTSLLHFTAHNLRRMMDGVDFHVAESCASGRALFLDVEPDLVVLDLRLPDGDGIELFEEWKATSPGLVGILVSAQSTASLKQKALALGFTRVLEKPYSADTLAAYIRNALRSRGGLSGSLDAASSPAGDEDERLRDHRTAQWRHDVKNTLSTAVVGIRAFAGDLREAKDLDEVAQLVDDYADRLVARMQEVAVALEDVEVRG